MDRRGVRVVALGAALTLMTGMLAGTASARTKHQSSSGAKTEIVIAALGPFFDATTGTKSSEWPAAVKARVKAANKAKELGPDVTLKVFECDTGLDPNDTEACARDAIDQGAVASVGFNGTTGTNLLPILEGAGIPAIGTVPVSPAETSSPVSFPLTSGVPGAFEALPIALGAKGATTQGLVVTDLGAATATAELFVKDSVTRQGYTLGEPVIAAPDQTDFAPIVAAATTGDPEGISVFIIGDAAANFIRQLRQGGYEGVLSSGSPFLTGSVIDALGADANGIQVPSLVRWQKSVGGKQYIKEMKKYAKGEAITDLAVQLLALHLDHHQAARADHRRRGHARRGIAARGCECTGQLRHPGHDAADHDDGVSDHRLAVPARALLQPDGVHVPDQEGQAGRDGEGLHQPVREAVTGGLDDVPTGVGGIRAADPRRVRPGPFPTVRSVG